MAARILSPLYWLLAAIIALTLFPVAVLLWLLSAPFDRRRVALHALTNVWGSLYSWIHPRWTVEVRGRELFDASQPVVMVSNHQSMVDIFVVHRLFRHFKWVSKIEVFRLPVIGWNMWLNGYVPIRRGDKASVVEMMRRCRARLTEGSSIMMFPEGTRSRTGELRPFKRGAFELAKEVGVPVQPLVVQGSAGALPKGGLLTGAARIRLTVLPPVPLELVQALSVDALCELVRDRIADFLAHEPWPPAPGSGDRPPRGHLAPHDGREGPGRHAGSAPAAPAPYGDPPPLGRALRQGTRLRARSSSRPHRGPDR